MPVYSPTVTKLVRQTVQALKRQYGGPAVLCSSISSTTDYRTGGKTNSFTTHSIRRAIVLPSNVAREVVASVARISSNKPLAFGGAFNMGDRGFIIDGADITGVDIKKDDWIVYRSERYSPTTIQKVAGGVAWALIARKHPGQTFAFDLAPTDVITISDTAEVDHVV